MNSIRFDVDSLMCMSTENSLCIVLPRMLQSAGRNLW